MKISTNFQTSPDGKGVGLPEGSILEINTDEKCIYIAEEVMNEYKLVWHIFRGSPVLIDQEDETATTHIKLQRYGMSLKGKHLLKVVAYGEDNQQDELDTEFFIW